MLSLRLFICTSGRDLRLACDIRLKEDINSRVITNMLSSLFLRQFCFFISFDLVTNSI